MNSVHNQGHVCHFRMFPVPPAGGHPPSRPPATTDVIYVPALLFPESHTNRATQDRALRLAFHMQTNVVRLRHVAACISSSSLLLLSMHCMDTFLCSPRHQLMDTGVVSSLGGCEESCTQVIAERGCLLSQVSTFEGNR